MKTQLKNRIGRRLTYHLILITALSFFAISCEEEKTAYMDETPIPKSGAVINPEQQNNVTTSPGINSIASIASQAGFNELLEALTHVDEELGAGLVELFSNGEGTYTVFAPTDEAFNRLYDELGSEVNEIKEVPAATVRDILFYHVTQGRRTAKSILPPVRTRNVETLLGETFSVTSDGQIIAIGNTANIIDQDISASNGIIHVIDEVILPIAQDEDSNNSDLGNGNDNSMGTGEESIAAVATEAGFNELISALAYVDEELNTGLVDLFSNGSDQYTVFAPSDEAFQRLYDAFDVNTVSGLPAETVRDVLLYHVTEGRRKATSVVPPVQPRKIQTLLGKSFTVDAQGKITAIGNTANITSADISASNGIIHVIDEVIIPVP